jgi:ribonuclease P protein component
MALPSDQRLTRTRDFAAVREGGKSWTGRCLILAIRSRPDAIQAHAGFTTTKRIGNAVTRNRVRRRLRMIVRDNFPRLTVTHDIVTIAKYPAVKADYASLKQEWEKLASRAGLFDHRSSPLPPASAPSLSDSAALPSDRRPA